MLGDPESFWGPKFGFREPHDLGLDFEDPGLVLGDPHVGIGGPRVQIVGPRARIGDPWFVLGESQDQYWGAWVTFLGSKADIGLVWETQAQCWGSGLGFGNPGSILGDPGIG